MKIFLNYIFSSNFEAVQESLLEHYDLEFVKNQIINPIKEKYKKVSNIVEKITEQSF